MITFLNKYEIGDFVNYTSLDYRGGKRALQGKIQKILCSVAKNGTSIMYLIGKETISEEFINGKINENATA